MLPLAEAADISECFWMIQRHCEERLVRGSSTSERRKREAIQSSISCRRCWIAFAISLDAQSRAKHDDLVILLAHKPPETVLTAN
jgi:hypothetical protein